MISLPVITLPTLARLRKFSKEYAELLPAVEKAFARVRWQNKKPKMTKAHKVEIPLHLVDDTTIQKLNRRYRKKNKTTDVLSFAYIEAEGQHFAHEPAGEVYISIDTAERQRREWQTTLVEELLILTTHGVLHILGYDHEASAKEAQKMQSLEKKILKALGLDRRALTEREWRNEN